MIERPSDEPPLCAFCKKQSAPQEYTHKTLSKMVCSSCCERQTVRDALQDGAKVHRL
jgi:hypothetical protein